MTNYIPPQGPSSAISTNLRKDERVSLQSVDTEPTQQQRVVEIGSSIPLVFGVYEIETNTGGVWITPPAARYGIQFSDTTGQRFSFGLIVSDGELPAIPIEDLYKGALSFDTLLSPNAVTTYGGLATTGFDYTLTYVTAGSPATGTPGGYGIEANSTNFPGVLQSVPGGGTFIPPGGGGYHYRTEATAGQTVTISAGLTADIARINSYTVGVFDVNFAPVNVTVDFYVGSMLMESVSTRNSLQLYQMTSTIGLTIPQGTGGLKAVVTIPVDAYIYYRLSYNRWFYFAASPDYSPGSPLVSSTLALFPGSGGSFEGMTTLAVTGGYTVGYEDSYPAQQVRCFIRNGLIVDKVQGGSGSSSSFADLAYYLLRKTGSVADQIISLPSFQQAAAFNEEIGLPFNGILTNSVNLRDYLSSVAPYYLLRFVQAGGQYMLKPLLPLTVDNKLNIGPITPAATFDNSNIVAGSYQKTYLPADRLRPFCALMSWRSQTGAVFPVSQVTEVRYQGLALDGPFEQYDMEEFCTDYRHAEAIGTYIIASRRYTKHTVSFQTTSAAATLLPTDVIEVAWTYEAQSVQQQTTDMYQIDSVIEDQAGLYRIEATHFPVDANGRNLVANEVAQILEVQLPEYEPPAFGTWSRQKQSAITMGDIGKWYRASSDTLQLSNFDFNGVDLSAELGAWGPGDTLQLSIDDVIQTIIVIDSITDQSGGADERWIVQAKSAFATLPDGGLAFQRTAAVLLASKYSFEDGESQFGVFGSDVRSTAQAFDGVKSAETAFAYADIEFTDVFPDPSNLYYMWSWRCYNSGNFQNHTFFGIRDVLNGAGFDLKTTGSTTISFFGSGAGQTIGTDTSVQNTWNHYYVQVYWVDGLNQRPEISLWINGSLVGNVKISTSTPYGPPIGINADFGDFRVARGSDTTAGTKYYDLCLGGTSNNPLAQMNQGTIVPADIESALEAVAPGPPLILRFATYGNPSNVGEWDYFLQTTPTRKNQIRFNYEDSNGVDVDSELFRLLGSSVQVWFSVDGRSYEQKTVALQRNIANSYYILDGAVPSAPQQGELLVSFSEQPRPAPASIYQWDTYGNEGLSNNWRLLEDRSPTGGPVSLWSDQLLFNFIDSNLENIDDYLLGRTSGVADVWISINGGSFQQYQTKLIGRNSTDSSYRFQFGAFTFTGITATGVLQLSFSDPGP